jgi:hypothetical protein
MSDIAKQRVAKELSEGVKTSLEVMIASGRVEEAKKLQERYQGFLDPVSAAAVQTKFTSATRKGEAYSFISNIRGKSEDAQIEAIDKIKDPELRSEVLKIKDSDDAKMESLRERKSKVNYNTLAGHVLDKMNSEQPYFGVADLENDPIYKNTWDNLDAKGKKAILEMVNSPKDTNPKAEARVQNLFFGNEEVQIETVTPEEFSSYLTGLNKADRKKYTTMFNKLRTQTASEERVTYKRAEGFLKDQFIIDGHIEKDQFGRIRGEDEETLINARNKLIDHLSTYKGPMNDKQLKDFVRDFSAAEIKGKVFNPQPRAVFKPKTAATTSNAPDVKVTGPELIRLKREFAQRNGGKYPRTTDEKFKIFVQQNVRN